MNFDLSEEQEMIVDAVQKFVANDSPVERFRKLRDHEAGWEKSVWKAMGEYGWLGVEVPEDQGGYGGSFFLFLFTGSFSSSGSGQCSSGSRQQDHPHCRHHGA